MFSASSILLKASEIRKAEISRRYKIKKKELAHVVDRRAWR
jgi:hypothetical protein